MSKTAKIKALWVCTWFPSNRIPYLGTFVKRQALATSLFADVAILYVLGDAISDYQIEIEQSNILTIRVYYPTTDNTFLKIFRQFRAQYKGYKIALSSFGKPDIVHVQSLYPAAIFALYLDFFKNIPFVVTEHFSGYMNVSAFKKQYFRRFFTHIVFKRAKVVIALSDIFIQALKNIGLKARQFRIIFNVVDTELFKPSSKTREAFEPYRFMNLSLFNDKNKNITGLIRCATKLAERRRDFILNIVGDGGDRDLIIQSAETLGVLNRFVFFKGYLFEKDAAKEMKQSDCVIMFSNIESQSVVTLETASCGLPLIATETGGIGERVTPETGILLNIGDEAALVEAMNDMIDNHHKYDPSVIRSKIVEKCSVDVVGQAIANIYHDVLKPTKP